MILCNIYDIVNTSIWYAAQTHTSNVLRDVVSLIELFVSKSDIYRNSAGDKEIYIFLILYSN